MTPIENNLLHLLHVASALVLMGCTFYAFAAPPATRKKVLIGGGVASLIVLLAGVRMWQAIYGFAPAGWIFVKIGCWLGLSALTGIGYRRRENVGVLIWVAIILAVIAVGMVYFRPF